MPEKTHNELMNEDIADDEPSSVVRMLITYMVAHARRSLGYLLSLNALITMKDHIASPQSTCILAGGIAFFFLSDRIF